MEGSNDMPRKRTSDWMPPIISTAALGGYDPGLDHELYGNPDGIAWDRSDVESPPVVPESNVTEEELDRVLTVQAPAPRVVNFGEEM